MSKSEWTVATLREAMITTLAERDRRYCDRMDRMHAEFMEHLNEARREVFLALTASDRIVLEVDKRHSAGIADRDKALSAAFAAAEKATEVRATAAEREFHEHLNQNRHETDLAFLSSEKAIGKAEVANEKRFEAVNEFRAQLADQARSFMPRTECEGRLTALQSELYLGATRINERLQDLADRVNRTEGRGAGLSAGWVYLLGALAAVGTLVSLYVAVKAGG